MSHLKNNSFKISEVLKPKSKKDILNELNIKEDVFDFLLKNNFRFNGKEFDYTIWFNSCFGIIKNISSNTTLEDLETSFNDFKTMLFNGDFHKLYSNEHYNIIPRCF